MSADEVKTKRRRLRWLVWIVILVDVPIIFVALLPTIISLGPVSEAVLSKVGEAAGCTIKAESLSLGWFSGQRVDGLEFEQKGRAKMSVRAISITAGLGSLLSKTPDLGAVEIIEPNVTAWLPAPPVEQPPVRRAPGPAGRPVAEPAAAKKGAFDIRGKVKVQGGTIQVFAPGLPKPWMATDVNFATDVNSLNEAAAFDMSFAQKDAGGTFKANGRLCLFRNGEPAPEKLAGDLTVDIAGFDLAPLGGLAAKAAGAPKVSGWLDANISLKMLDPKHMELVGHAAARDLSMTGGPLGGDRPIFDKVTAAVACSVSNEVFALKTARIVSPLLTGSASGQFRSEAGGKYPAGVLMAEGALDVPALASAFKETLHLEKDLKVDSGRVILKTQIEATGDKMAFTGNLESHDIRATRAGQPIVLETLRLVSRGSLNEQGLVLDDLSLQAPFASAKGHGNADDLSVEASIDLGKMDAELRKMIDLGPLSAKGSVRLAASVKKRSENMRKLDFSAEASGVNVAGLTPRPVVQDSVKVSAQCLVKTPGGEIAELMATLRSSLASLDLSATRVVTGDTTGDRVVDGGTFKIDADLQAVSSFAHDCGLLTNQLVLTGKLAMKGEGALKGDHVSIGPASLAVVGFAMTEGEKALPPADIKLGLASAEANAANRRLTVNQLNVQSPFGRLNVPAMTVGDWSNALATAKGQLSLSSDLGSALRQAGSWSSLPKESAVSGDATMEITLAPETGGAARLTALAQVTGLAMISGAVTNFSDPKVSVAIDARLETGLTNMVLKMAKITSVPVVLDASGRLADPSRSRNLELDGSLEVDFARVAEIVRFLSGSDIEMDGKAARRFHLRTSLADMAPAAVLRATTASADLYLKRLKVMGVETGELTPALTVSNSLAHAKMHSTVNKGAFALDLTVDGTGEPAMLTMPENSRILKDVELSQDMVSQLLARANPLFSGCSVLGGRIGLMMEHVKVPLDSVQVTNLTFAGDVDFTDVRLAQGGLIKDIVGLAKMDSSAELVVSNQTVRFACANGRITTTPFVVMAGRDPLTVSGHMTVGGELHYKAEFPVTEKLVGKKNYPRVKDVKITLPIEGTVQNPQPMSEAITKAVEKLVVDVGTGVLVEEGIKALDKWLAPQKKKDNKK